MSPSTLENMVGAKIPKIEKKKKKKKNILVILNLNLNIQRHLSKLNTHGTNFCVHNKHFIGLYGLNSLRFPTLKRYLKFNLYRISVYLGVGLDTFSCILLSK